MRPEGQITSSLVKSPQLLPSPEVPGQGLVQHRGYSNSITSCLASASASPTRVPWRGLHCTEPHICQAATEVAKVTSQNQEA